MGLSVNDGVREEPLPDLESQLERFEEAWELGNPPAIKEFLQAASEADRRELLIELVKIDLECRWKHSGRQATNPDVDAAFPAQPLLEDYAEVHPDLGRPDELPLDLIIEEYRIRHRFGDRPSHDDYLVRFARNGDPLPAALERVDHEIAASDGRQLAPDAGLASDALAQTVIEKSHNVETDNLPPAGLETPVPQRLGEYRLLRKLGSGGMGVVYEAVHAQHGNHVALKTLPFDSEKPLPDREKAMRRGEALHRFNQEFRKLREVSHPNLIRLISLDEDGSQRFITMDLIEGTDFLSYVRPGDRLDESRLRSALSQLVAGVMALHNHKIIHRDLKPSNVMVTHDGKVVVLDFGLVAEMKLGTVASVTHAGAGTLPYMAPEQMLEQKVAPDADWFAVGVMLHEAMVGERPFQSNQFMELLRMKQSRDIPSLRNRSKLPQDLADLCEELLSGNPADRPDAAYIAKVASAKMVPVASANDEEHRLIHRESQLAALDEALHSVEEQHEPATVFVSGKSGEGKSSLIEHFLAPLRAEKRLTILSGRCYDRESVPFKALDSLIDALASYLRGLNKDDLALLIPDDVAVLARVFPVLQRVDLIARAPQGRAAVLDDQQVRTRAFSALRELLVRLSDFVPIVLFIDDLQWGDADSAEVMFEILRPPEAPQLLFLGSFRSDEAAESPFLLEWDALKQRHGIDLPHKDVNVGPLSVDDCVELMVSELGQDTEVIRQRAAEFAEETGGNPFLLLELISCFDPESDTFRAIPMHEVIDTRLSRLPENAGNLLEVIAVSGQAMLLSEATQAAGFDVSAIATVTHMRTEKLVRLIGSDDDLRVDTYHDKIRETVLGKMEDDLLRQIHKSIAVTIESNLKVKYDKLAAGVQADVDDEEPEVAIDRVYDLAYHYDAAGHEKALIYAMVAAEQARRQSAWEVAIEQYAISMRNSEKANNDIQFRLAMGCGYAMMQLGLYDQAVSELKNAIVLVEDRFKKARLEALQGELAFKRGSMNQSVDYIESGLRRLGEWVPTTKLRLVIGIAKEILIQVLHTCFPGRLHRNKSTKETELIIHLYNWYFHSACFQSTLSVMWSTLAGLNRSEVVPPSRGLAFSSATHGMLMSMLGWYGRSPYYMKRASDLAKEYDDVWSLGVSHSYAAIGYSASASFRNGIEETTAAEECFERVGDMWELHMAHFHKSCCYFGSGELENSIAESKWTFESSRRINDSRVMCSSYLWARATNGDFPFEQIGSCYPNRPDDVMSTVHGVMAEGHWHRFHGRTLDSLNAFERAAEMVRKSLCINSHMIVTLPELAKACRLHAAVIESDDPQQCKQLQKRALRLAKWSVRITRLFAATYPLSLRELALIYGDLGKYKKGLKFAKKSCELAEKQEAKYEHVQSLLVCGQLGKELGRPEAASQIAEAEKELVRFQEMVDKATQGDVVACDSERS